MGTWRRNRIMKKFHANPSVQIESKDLPDIEVGDLDARQEVLVREFADFTDPNIQLAARNCFILEDPPDDKKEQTGSESVVNDAGHQDARMSKIQKTKASRRTSPPQFWIRQLHPATMLTKMLKLLFLKKRVQMVRVKGFVLTEKLLFKDGRIMFDWWDEIDESKEWQRFIFHLLSASYAVVSIVALVQLCRIQLSVSEYGWTTQKVFHLMNFIVNGLRAVLFGFYKSVFLVKSKALEMVLLDLPGLLFFSTYTLLVLFWAEIYHQARSLPINKLRPAYYSINGFIYFAQACLWISVRLSQSNLAVELSRLFISVISFCAALGFMIYGGRLFFMLRRFPIESRGRQRKLFEVGFVTGICCTCFLIRCIVSTLSANMNAGLDVLDHPILNLIYYMFVEILPSALVLFILRKLPPKRVSEQYHPIR
ncbi:tobamovirus multiplication protein 1-like [Gossypium arboreum]|uniref:tobamovirus multiplication protein 1-like n=1 Tax=Gossypium arboreum TaxID=29729 RepID=UPI0008194E9C|nr:tobamovirus multiplication protein 1-like [Gossypium arboreum]